MENTALISPAGLSALQLRELRKAYKEQRNHELLLRAIDTVKPIVTNEIFLVLAGFAIGNKMVQNYEQNKENPKFPWLETYEATILGYGLIAIATAKAGVFEAAAGFLEKIKP